MTAPIFNPPIGEPPSIQLIAPTRLKVDESYQRTLSSRDSQALVGRIARDWDWRLCVPLLVSQRDDGLYVIDGQHRREAAARRGDIALLPCCVSEYGSAAEEASIFVAANRKRRAVNRVDTFRAAVLAGDARAMQIVALLDTAGLRIARTSSAASLQPAEVNAIGGLERSLAAHGPERLGVGLALLGDAFRGEIIFHQAPLIMSLCALLSQHSSAAARSAVATALGKLTSREWFDLARTDPAFGPSGQNAVLALKRAIVTKAGLLSPTPEPAIAPAQPVQQKRPRTFEEQMEAVANGAKLVRVEPLRRPDPQGTLGGVGSSML